MKRKSDFLQFRPYRAIVASPIKERQKGGGLLKWISAFLLAALMGALIFVFRRMFAGVQ